ncbi:MAG TPA: YaiO family outer membrane beta-barrel protein [Bryobacteraceae bacterium]|nr:YaiO family outer membrane beta-barrel protein [Bryobacteraceae bacterium]
MSAWIAISNFPGRRGRKSRTALHNSLATLVACVCLSGYGQGQKLIDNAGVETQDVVATARQLATGGHRAEALEMLDKRLAEKRTDSDARVLRGVILSWEGRYDDARRDLEMVLAQHRDHGDALPALINVEMWSDHPERAEELARDALRRNPTDPDLLLARAKALKALKRNREALNEIERLLLVDPGNQKAAAMKVDLGDSLRKFSASFDHSTEWFSDGRTPWQETQVQLSRDTEFGSVIARFDRANRFGLTSQMVEIDAYPHIRRGTYAYLNVGYSPDANLYPQTRLAADLYQSLGHGFEASGGFRQLHFGGNIHIYTASITKYYGDWMFTGRTFLTPDDVGTSRSGQFLVRRYLGSATDYVSFRVGYGSAPAEVTSVTDIEILNSQSFAAEINHAIGRRFMVLGHFGYSYEDRINITGLHHYLADVTTYYRF